MIWIHELDKSFGKEKEIFSGVNLVIPSGLSVGILGAPGSGKTTLLNMIGGAELPSWGKIVLDGTLLWMKSIDTAMHGQMTLYQSLRFLGRLYTEDDEEMEGMVEEILSLAELGDQRHQLWSKLSTAEKQLLKYSALTTIESDYLLIDGALAPLRKTEFFREKMRKKMKKTTVLMAAPPKVLKDNCDAGIVIQEKKLRYFDSIDEAVSYQESVEKK